MKSNEIHSRLGFWMRNFRIAALGADSEIVKDLTDMHLYMQKIEIENKNLKEVNAKLCQKIQNTNKVIVMASETDLKKEDNIITL